ncbi:hypothetical protein M8818_001263 [Zalaria obscura]|uniref:Uncharacterized protein n=1 Tax=Zalaria obscura TaxID=2024903 RepID=A0ACC3SL98_9PEZI
MPTRGAWNRCERAWQVTSRSHPWAMYRFGQFMREGTFGADTWGPARKFVSIAEEAPVGKQHAKGRGRPGRAKRAEAQNAGPHVAPPDRSSASLSYRRRSGTQFRSWRPSDKTPKGAFSQEASMK